jgi:quinoprotein glucose dehydrogenase
MNASRNSRYLCVFAALVATSAAFIWVSASSQPDTADDSWPSHGHDAGGMRYSPLTQINRENVAQLKVAWSFHTGDVSEGGGRRKRSGFETTPLLVDGTLYLTTAFNRIVALDRLPASSAGLTTPRLTSTETTLTASSIEA